MTWRDAIIAVAVAAVVYVSYSAGWQTGHEASPQYTAAEASRDAAFWAVLDQDETAEDRACRAMLDAALLVQ